MPFLSSQRSAPAEWRAHSRLRVSLAGGACTTLHVCSFERARTRMRVVALECPMRVLDRCRTEGVRDAIVGGFFVREEGPPLGDLWSAGRRLGSRPFDAPWQGLRACVAIDRETVRVARRDELDAVPGGDLLQAPSALVELGADTAINLDCGGSTSLVIGFRLLNRPREEHGMELAGGRNVVTALAFLPV